MTNRNKFVFLDRDGVINRDPGEFTETNYVTAWKEFHFLPGVFGALRDLTQRGFKIAIVSNQGGVNKGIYTKARLDEITKKMVSEIELRGAKIYSVQYCVHTKDDNCDCRKPKTGLFKRASEGLGVDFKKTYCIGDAQRDIEAGKSAGCRTILVLSGKTKNRKEVEAWPVKPDFVAGNLNAAVEVVIKRENEGL